MDNWPLILALAAVAVIGVGAAIGWFVKYRRLAAKYAPTMAAERELHRAHDEFATLRQEQVQFIETSRRTRESLNAEYVNAKSTFDRLREQLNLLEGNMEDISFGLYKPQYNFETSEQYRDALDQIRGQEKSMVREGNAARCAVEWSIGGDKRAGVRMQKQYMKLMLRAFNGECDAAVAKVAWNNVVRMEERIQKCFDAINELGEVMQISITHPYREVKLAELRLEHEMEEKKHAEAEEQRRIKEQMREEERAQREIERAKEEAEAEETRYEKALERARADVAKAQGERAAELNLKIGQLEQQLLEAQQKKARAKSMAELTRSGHVYIISNIGSFGENVFKIGMTRRLEPRDRVRELGDASVPFDFDVHAMIYSRDAPALENAFHRFLDAHRVNGINLRKEFFRVSLEEIERFAVQREPNVTLIRTAEARHYRETLALRAKHSAPQSQTVNVIEFPDRVG
jgi:Domain of unknown function (DUF4041)/Meiotically up-regulated gene 113